MCVWIALIGSNKAWGLSCGLMFMYSRGKLILILRACWFLCCMSRPRSSLPAFVVCRSEVYKHRMMLPLKNNCSFNLSFLKCESFPNIYLTPIALWDQSMPGISCNPGCLLNTFINGGTWSGRVLLTFILCDAQTWAHRRIRSHSINRVTVICHLFLFVWTLCIGSRAHAKICTHTHSGQAA